MEKDRHSCRAIIQVFLAIKRNVDASGTMSCAKRPVDAQRIASDATKVVHANKDKESANRFVILTAAVTVGG